MNNILVIVGLLCAVVGLIGCVFPILPGPVLSFASLIILSIAGNWQPLSPIFLIIMAILLILLIISDYVIPAMGAKKYGASKWGMWGSILGMLIGIFFFPPWGIFIGAFIGALAGEIITGKKGKEALRVGWGIFVGNMINMGLKLAFCIAALVVYIKEMI